MITVQIPMQEKVALSAMTEADARGMTFPEYVEWKLGLPLHQSTETLELATPPQSAQEIARQIFEFALVQPAYPVSDEGDLESRPYLVEALYKQMPMPMPWSDIDRGFRIMIGKAFKREVDAQLSGGTLVDTEKGYQMKVEFTGKNAQNQAVYKTVRVG